MKILQKFLEIIDRIPVPQGWRSVWGKRVFVISVGALLLIVLLVALGSSRGSMTETCAVVQEGDFTVDLIESGDVEAVSQMLISAPMMWGAQLQVIDLVPEGTIVKKGDFLLQFDVSDLEDSKKLREDQLASLLADLEKLKAQQALTIFNQENSLKLAQYSYEQAGLRLEMRKFESQAKQEEARLQLKQAEIELEKVKKQLVSQKIIHRSQIIKRETAIREARNRVESIVDRIDKLQLRAPIDGMVVYQQIRGERVKEGYESRPGWPLMSIPDLSRMQLKLFVNEVDRLKVRVGQTAHITLVAYPNRKFQGKVKDVSRLAQVVTGEERLKGFVVYIDIEGTDPVLKPGITAKVRIVLETLEDVMYVPVGTVFEINGQSVVFPEGKQSPRVVYLGPRNDAFVVVQSGVEPGMKLSYVSPLEESSMLGMAEERRRIEEVNRTLRESFAVFQERGILHDYGIASQEAASDESEQEPPIDLDRLPASIRQRLEGRDTERGSTPTRESGSPEGKQEK